MKTKNNLKRGVATGLLLAAPYVMPVGLTALLTSCPNPSSGNDEELPTFVGGVPVYGNTCAASYGIFTSWYDGLLPAQVEKFSAAVNRINITSGNTVSLVDKVLNIGSGATEAEIFPVIAPLIVQLQQDNGVRLAFVESAKETVRRSFGKVRGA